MEVFGKMLKSEIYQKELAKLQELFKDIEEPKQKLVEGLVEDAAFIFSENIILKQSLAESGMVKVHPDHPNIQKPTEAAKQYLKNVNSYAVIIKTLNGVLSKGISDDEDALGEFE